MLVLLLGCEQIDDIISYFVDLSVNVEEGNSETEFIFEVDTNDEVLAWYQNDEEINIVRSTSLKFLPGEHIISIVTANNKTDSVAITVIEDVIEPVIEEVEPVVEEPVIIDPIVEVVGEIIEEPIIKEVAAPTPEVPEKEIIVEIPEAIIPIIEEEPIIGTPIVEEIIIVEPEEVIIEEPIVIEPIEEIVEPAVEEVEEIIEEIIEEIVEEIEEPIIYTTRFEVTAMLFTENATTQMSLNYPTLTFEGIDYNVEAMALNVEGLPVKARISGTERIISMTIYAETGTDSFIFHSDNMFLALEFRDNELDPVNMGLLLDYLNYVEPEPDYTSVTYNLSNSPTGFNDILRIEDESYFINFTETTYMDAEGATDENLAKNISINIQTLSNDDFILRDANMIKFFGFDSRDMSRSEIVQMIDVISRYPEEYLLDIVYDYWPGNPVLEEMGYFD